MSPLNTVSPPPLGDIMIVDDNPANLKLLEDMLLGHGCEVRSFPLGRLALAAASKHRPDLILLDINMPEMNGYEVCAKLKDNPDLRAIPVIFLSALHEIQDKVKAFRVGGVDYIAKPFQFEEVRARVETHLQLHRLQRALQRQNEQLEETVAARTLELAAANARLKILDDSKNDFLKLISHEFRTPLNGLLGVGSLILSAMPADAKKEKLQDLYDRSRRRILSILDDALLLTTIDGGAEQFQPAAVPLGKAVERAIESAREFAQTRQVVLSAPDHHLGMVAGDEELLARALQVLLETAVKFSEKGGTVQLPVGAGAAEVVIESHGRTIPDGALPKFFDLLAIGEAITPGGDLGVGPPLAQRILALFGGSVSVANQQPAGIKITIALKYAGPPKFESRAVAI